MVSSNYDEGVMAEPLQVAQNKAENATDVCAQDDADVCVHMGAIVVCGDKHNKVVAGDYVQVVDNASNRPIIQGFVNDEKTSCPDGNGNQTALEEDQKLFTLDGRYYFSMKSGRYTVYRLPETAIDENFIKKNYHMRTWRSFNETGLCDADMFVEHSKEELDKEVEGLVDTLNRFSLYMETTGSCSGHDRCPAWVSVQFDSIRALEDFLDVFEPFKAKMNITTRKDLSQGEFTFDGNAFFPRKTVLEIRTKDVGQPAYDVLNDFGEYLGKVIHLRNKTFNSLSDMIAREKKRQSQR